MTILQAPSPFIDLLFPVRGARIALDHGYRLYAAIAHMLETTDRPWFHDNGDIGLHLIRGRYQGKGQLALTNQSHIGIRAPGSLIHRFLPLAGKRIVVADEELELGMPRPHTLRPATSLYSHMVTTRNGDDEARFDAEISRQLTERAIDGKVQRGPRRVFRIKDKCVVAHSLLVTQLTAEESVRLQEAGVGGRRKLGCGVFLPWTR
jgi:CRISPR-associated protein Cas6